MKTKRLQLLRTGAIAVLVVVSPLLGWSAEPPTNDAAAIILAAPLSAQDTNFDATNNLGSWIWAAQTFDLQTCQFWRTFEIPTNSPVTHALLVMTVDNEFTLYLDGRDLGHGDEWRELFEHDVTHLMSAGKHTLAVKAYNSFSYAGMIFGLQVDFADGNKMEIKSDESWRIVPDGVERWERKTEASENWPPATVIAEWGGGPWGSTPSRMDRMPTLEPIKLLFWQTGWFQVTLLSVCGLVILLSFRLMAQLALHQKDRRLLQQERERIARDIHDDLGSRMTQLVLHGEVAMNELPPSSPTRPQLDRICEESREMLSRMDEILWAVNPQRDTLRDFTSYVCDYVQEFLKPTGIQSLFEFDPEMATAALDLPLRRSLLMAIKETLNNAVKHSEATELRLLIHVHGEDLSVVVEDNGKGFDASASKARGNGLANLRQRMSEFGGSCDVTSQPGKGCRIAFKIPLPSLRRRRWGWIWNSRLCSRRFGGAKPRAVETQPHVRPAA